MSKSVRQTLRVLLFPDPDPWLDLMVEAATEVLRARGVRVIVERRVQPDEMDAAFDVSIGTRRSFLEIQSEGTLDESRARRSREDWALACAAIFAYLEAVERRTRGVRN